MLCGFLDVYGTRQSRRFGGCAIIYYSWFLCSISWIAHRSICRVYDSISRLRNNSQKSDTVSHNLNCKSCWSCWSVNLWGSALRRIVSLTCPFFIIRSLNKFVPLVENQKRNYVWWNVQFLSSSGVHVSEALIRYGSFTTVLPVLSLCASIQCFRYRRTCVKCSKSYGGYDSFFAGTHRGCDCGKDYSITSLLGCTELYGGYCLKFRNLLLAFYLNIELN